VPYLIRPAGENAPPPTAAPAAPRFSLDSPRGLERAAAAVLPAVVLVETPGTRGTGFLIGPDIGITNSHVVEGNAYVTLQFGTGETVSARVSASAPEYDLAVLRLSSARTTLQPLALGELARVRVGQEVLAVGSPLGLRNTVTRGIVSAVRRVGPVVLVQTDAAINPGNSGGPLVDATGRVIAIATMKVSGGAESLGFAVAADHARALVDTGSAALAGTRIPPAAPTDSLPPPADSVETARANGAVQFEKAMALAARRADSLDEYWSQFAKVCITRPSHTDGDRAWFAIWERSFATNAVAPACVADFRSFTRSADVLREGVVLADEAARQAGVYPGSRRELLAKYRLAWDGWER
jgi:S1-C subfamily serine protease